MTVAGAYDDGEDVPTPGDGWADEHRALLDLVRAIPDADTRRAVFAVFLVAVGERIGR